MAKFLKQLLTQKGLRNDDSMDNALQATETMDPWAEE